MRRLVDISVPLRAGIASDPPGLTPEIDYLGHQETRDDLLRFFPGASGDDLPDGEGWAVEWVRMTTHSGTHLDAPYHYASTMDGGQRAITIDEVPLEWCFQPGVKLDLRHLEDGYVVTPDDIDAELDRIGHRLSPLEIVMVNTSAGERYGHDDYVAKGCGIGRGHKAGREVGYCHLEKLHNLEVLPAVGFQVVCFPTKVHAASAGWTRAVAVIDEAEEERERG